MSTGIQWTDETWNPVTGCSKVSPGCANCYAETLALTRLAGKAGYPGLPWTPDNAAANVSLRPDRLTVPLRWKAPRRVFVNSMSDLFHELIPDDYIDRVFAAMAVSQRHSFQVLTKRPERMRDYFHDFPERELAVIRAMSEFVGWDAPWAGKGLIRWMRDSPTFLALPNVWLGTSIENDRWTVRADYLRETPAAVRFLSLEPLLGPLPSLALTDIDWVIVGGESGPEHRPIDPDWVRDLRDRSLAAGAAFFFKQWGGRTPKSGGRLLDGRTWDQFPVQSLSPHRHLTQADPSRR